MRDMLCCFDSHVHLDFAAFDDMRADVIERAVNAGVREMFVPGCCPQQWRTLSRLRELGWGMDPSQAVRVYVGVGLHPYFSEDPAWSKPGAVDALVADMESHISLLEAVGLGEMGIDKNKGAPLPQQVELLEAQLQLARQRCLPIVLHQVGRQTEFLEVLRRVGISEAGGILHGFSGDTGWAKVLMKMGLFLGVGSGILRPARDRLRATVAQLPLERIVVETDAPDGRIREVAADAALRSEPMDVRQVILRLSRLLGKSEQTVAEQTRKNAIGLFQD